MVTANKFTGEVKKRIDEIEQEGFLLTNQENRTICRRDYKPISAYGGFNINKLDNLETNVTILTFQNETGSCRYCIFDKNNEIIKEPLSRVNYQDNRIKNSTAYKVHEFSKKLLPEIKEIFHAEHLPEKPEVTYISPAVYRESLSLNANDLSFMMYHDLAEVVNNPNYNDKTAETFAHETALKYKESIKEGVRYASDIRLNWNTYGLTTEHPGISIAEEFSCGKERQYYISSHFLNVDDGINSSGVCYIADRTQELVRLTAKEMIEKNEITLDADTANDLNVSAEMLKKVIESGDKEVLNKYLTRTEGIYEGGSGPAIDTKLHSLDADLITKLHEKITNNPETINPDRINSDLDGLLNDMTRYNRKLSKEECIDVLVDYVNKPLSDSISFKNLKSAIIQPDFAALVKNGKSLKEISDDLCKKFKEGKPIYEKQDYYYAGKVWQVMKKAGINDISKRELLTEAKKQVSKAKWYLSIKETMQQKTQEKTNVSKENYEPER